jgi:hypothetical protein
MKDKDFCQLPDRPPLFWIRRGAARSTLNQVAGAATGAHAQPALLTRRLVSALKQRDKAGG